MIKYITHWYNYTTLYTYIIRRVTDYIIILQSTDVNRYYVRTMQSRFMNIQCYDKNFDLCVRYRKSYTDNWSCRLLKYLCIPKLIL